MEKLREVLSRYHLLLAYIIFSVAISFAIYELQELSNRMEFRSELRSHQLCENQNDTRQVLTDVLKILAAPREEDEPGDLERRQRLFDEITPLIEPVNCPPAPTR